MENGPFIDDFTIKQVDFPYVKWPEEIQNHKENGTFSHP